MLYLRWFSFVGRLLKVKNSGVLSRSTIVLHRAGCLLSVSCSSARWWLASSGLRRISFRKQFDLRRSRYSDPYYNGYHKAWFYTKRLFKKKLIFLFSVGSTRRIKSDCGSFVYIVRNKIRLYWFSKRRTLGGIWVHQILWYSFPIVEALR